MIQLSKNNLLKIRPNFKVLPQHSPGGTEENHEKPMKFRIVFWDVLPCKIIVDRRFRGACCLHHQG
jgi:hypothetical protein